MNEVRGLICLGSGYNCKCIYKKNISLCLSNSKYGELVRVLSVK